MGEKIRAMTLRGCVCHNVELIPSTGPTAGEVTISSPVGEGGQRVGEDVRSVQKLLNRIGPADGGPAPKLDEDGMIGPKTIGAIRAFQQKHLGFNDGRVDPKGPTLKKMNEMTGAGAPEPQAAAMRDVTGEIEGTPDFVVAGRRLGKARLLIPDVKYAIDRGNQFLDRLMTQLSSPSNLIQPNPNALGFIDKHFRITRPFGQDLMLLKRIVYTMGVVFARGDRKLTLPDITIEPGVGITINPDRVGSSKPGKKNVNAPWGIGIFAYDRFFHPNWVAYTYTGNMTRDGATVPGKSGDHTRTIYLSVLFDFCTSDYCLKAILHELAHFVGDENSWSGIVDHGYSYEPRFKTLTRWQRLHNAESYSNFLFELAFGTSRMNNDPSTRYPGITSGIGVATNGNLYDQDGL